MIETVLKLGYHLWSRIAEVRKLCGELPEELNDLEMRLRCLLDLQKQAAAADSKKAATALTSMDLDDSKEASGIWAALEDLISQTCKIVDVLVGELRSSKGRTKKKALLWAKTFFKNGAYDYERTISRLCRQLQIVLGSVSAFRQGEMVDVLKDNHELLKAVLLIQEKRQMELEACLMKVLGPGFAPVAPPVPSIAAVGDSSSTLTSGSAAASESMSSAILPVYASPSSESIGSAGRDKRRHSTPLSAVAKASEGKNFDFKSTVTMRTKSTRRFSLDDSMFEHPAMLEEEEEEELEDIDEEAETKLSARKLFYRADELRASPTLEADEEDRLMLSSTLKLRRGASLAEIEAVLKEKGFGIRLTAKPMSGFVEIDAKPKNKLAAAFSDSKGHFKVRWLVLRPGEECLVYFKSPHDADLKPEKGRIHLTGAKIEVLDSKAIKITCGKKKVHILRTSTEDMMKSWRERILAEIASRMP